MIFILLLVNDALILFSFDVQRSSFSNTASVQSSDEETAKSRSEIEFSQLCLNPSSRTEGCFESGRI